RRLAKGFSLLEMLISVSLLVVITGAVFEQIMVMQKNAARTGAKVDSDQQARAFVDQVVRDLHMAGYPKAEMYSSATLDNTSPLVAAGVVSVSPTQIILEGDVNSDGFVESVNVGYVPNSSSDPECPCVRRSAAQKVVADPLKQPVSPNYTETEHVIPPGTGPGQSGEDLFVFYDSAGNQVPVASATDPTGLNIATVKINVSLLTDAGAGQIARTSLSATARLNQ
ncbi:MAG TPA: prepilin-type N-terminal cleavage/methylation domain-containing protein, partial [Verrucomicrobiae bacterium]|nr:prepilin-type N-terminal cleavage/methylation domain-containing protein [Verrucomicrobiae bacterium]